MALAATPGLVCQGLGVLSNVTQLHSATSGPASSFRKNNRPGSVGMKLAGIQIEGP